MGLIIGGTLYDLQNTVIVPTEIGSCPPVESQSRSTAAACAAERKTLAIAAEAYLAEYGTLPKDEATLVSAQLLLTEFENYDLATSNGVIEVVLIGDVCAPFDTDTDTVACEAEARTRTVAAEAFTADQGRPPDSEAELVPTYLREELTGCDLVEGEVVPVAGCERASP